MTHNPSDESLASNNQNEKNHPLTECSEPISFPETVQAEHFIALQRYHLLGTLTAGVMHEFNNALMTLLVSVGLIQKVSPLSPEQQKLVEKVQDVILKASKSTSLLLEFARLPVLETTVFEINFLVKEAFALVRDRLPVTVTPILELTPEKLTLRGDVRQLYQALVNGMLNAAESIAAGGHLHVRTERIAATEATTYTNEPIPNQPTSYVKIAISDSGSGLAPELEDPFKPFASVKGTGRGLGLTAAQAIIHQHGGFIHLAYQAPRGTLLTILLPLANPA